MVYNSVHKANDFVLYPSKLVKKVDFMLCLFHSNKQQEEGEKVQHEDDGEETLVTPFRSQRDYFH